MTTNDTSWVDRLASRITRDSDDGATTGPEQPAWARVTADRAAGREASAEDVREARVRATRPRTEFERRVLARLGHDTNDGPPAA